MSGSLSGAPLPRVIVFAARPEEAPRRGRTLRALRRRGLDPVDATMTSGPALAAQIAAGPAWLVRAGAFPAGVSPADDGRAPVVFPQRSATGRPLCALGAVLPAPEDDDEGYPGEEAARWREALARTGGDLAREALEPHAPLPLASVYADVAAAARLAEQLTAGGDVAAALRRFIASPGLRLVRIAALDVRDDARLRVLLAVTSLQQGGAERVVKDLAEELPRVGVRPRVVVLGRPSRKAFPEPPGTVDLSSERDRIGALVEIAALAEADVLHAHLLTGPELARLKPALPLVVTVHNTRPGWPEGLAELGALGAPHPGGPPAAAAALFVACSCAVEADLRASGIPGPRRTVWNGVDVHRIAGHRAKESAAARAAGAALRRAIGFSPEDLVLLSIANPRPQKQLHLLAPVLAAARGELERRGEARQARLLVVGDAAPKAEPARAALEALREATARRGLEAHVRLAGSMDDVTPALAAADALVSVSAHEGLSLAHLEALAAGLPVVALDAGGTREIAAEMPALTVLEAGALPERVGEIAVARALQAPEDRPAPPEAAALGARFDRAVMARRYAALYPRAVEAEIAASRAPYARRGVFLVTNNFSTGGAQSSARRLLVALAESGVPARAAVLEEQPAYPTPGRRALEARGVPVLALLEDLPFEASCARLLEAIDAAAPAAVIFWNALAKYKVALADALLSVPVFDVSPGEMFFASLDRYFARPLPALPYRDARAYGERLAGVIVKYEAEAARAARSLGAKVTVIPNGVDLARFAPPFASSRAVPGAPVVFGTAARIAPQKKLEELIEAFARAVPALPSSVLRVAGAPERGAEGYAEELRRASSGLPVEWVGEREDPVGFLAELDVFAMISEPAGCPNASLEAMAAGLPVVATDVGGASEQVVDGVTGRLVPRGDPGALAAALVSLGSDRELRRALGEASRARAEARFDLRMMVAAYRATCLGDGPGAASTRGG